MKRVETRRTKKEELLRQSAFIQKNELMTQVLNGLNIYTIIMNSKREILYMNKEFCTALHISLEKVIGARPGEILACKYAKDSEDGCGYSANCILCEARNEVFDAILCSKEKQKEVSIISEIQGKEITSTFEQKITKLEVENNTFFMVSFADRTSEVMKNNIERVFYHDILNSANSLYNAIRLLQLENKKFEEDEEIQLIEQYIENIIEDIEYQKSLSYAEKDTLKVAMKKFSVIELMKEIIYAMQKDERFRHIKVVCECDTNLGDIVSDKILLRRIFMNLLKNAFEANKENSIVKVKVKGTKESIHIGFHNEEVIPVEYRKNMFGKGSSSKGVGRGFGTYGSKLLLNKYLHGDLTFTSSEERGTDFTIVLPVT